MVTLPGPVARAVSRIGTVKIARLMQMTPVELAGRGRQRLVRHLDRFLEAGGGRPGRVDRRRPVWPERLRGFVEERFFPGLTDPGSVALLTKRFPHLLEGLVEKADSVVAGRFDLLGYTGLSFGDPIDWHLEPLAGRRAPLVHWSRLDPLDSRTVGDAKVVWEINRHQWFVWLGLAYVFTRDERYATCFTDRLLHWKRENPVGLGINWTSSLELALRIMAWCWALALFRESASLTAEFVEEVVDSVDAQARHVERYLSHYFSPNTHLTGEALGLLYTGIVFSQLSRAARWRRVGAKVLIDQLPRQILDDGVYFEQSSCYQRYTVEIGLHFLVLAARNGVSVPAGVRERVERAIEVLLFWQRPDGSMPQIGDADGGSLLPLCPRDATDYRGVFAVAAAIFRRGDFGGAAGGLAPEVVWMLGPEGAATLDSLETIPPARSASRVFPRGGYVVMRSSWEREAHHLIFDVGPLGCPVSGGHGHADLLSIQCSAFGEPFLVDAGTYCYTADPAWRDFFRSTAAHSTVTVEGLSQAVPRGPFAWEARPRAVIRCWRSTDTLDVMDAEHAAYECLPDPVIHRRRVLWVKPHYWVIVDDLRGHAECRMELRFQFAPVQVTLGAAPWARATGSSGHGLLLRPFATVDLRAQLFTGESAPIQGWVSPDYGQLQPAPALVYSTVARLPLRIATLLLPTQDLLAAPPAVSPLFVDGAGPLALSMDRGREVVHFGACEKVIARPSGATENPAC